MNTLDPCFIWVRFASNDHDISRLNGPDKPVSTADEQALTILERGLHGGSADLHGLKVHKEKDREAKNEKQKNAETRKCHLAALRLSRGVTHKVAATLGWLYFNTLSRMIVSTTHPLAGFEPFVPFVVLGLVVLVLALTFMVILQSRRLKAVTERWSQLMEGAETANLEVLLKDHLRGRVEAEQVHEEFRERLNVLEQQMKGAKRYVGLVRFDAFDGVGGEQSFALAIYDDRGNGALLTSLVGRAEGRVYCKSLVEGKTEHSLSAEEERAITAAAQQRSSAKAIS